jgi:integrase
MCPVAQLSVHKVSTASTTRPFAGQARLTATRVQSLKPGRRQRDVSDPECRGLTLRIEPNGSKTWLFRYKWRKQTVRLSLGAVSEYNSLRHARNAAGQHRSIIERGIDPRTARAPRRPTPSIPLAAGRLSSPNSIEFLAHEFLERHVKPNRRHPAYVQRVLENDVLPEWKGRDARTITPREVVELLDKIVARGSRVMANRTAGLLGQLFKFGIHRAVVDDSPVKLLYRPGGREKPRERAFSDEELKAFLVNLDDACRFQKLPHVLRLLLLTLQRRGELALAEWREFDFKARTWTIPDAHAKSGKGHVVPLSEWAIEELQKLKVMAGGSRYVLPNADKTAPADPKYITRSVARCLKRFKKHGVAAFTAHDLRRTGRTGLAKLGIKTDIGERVLNHARERIEATYDVHGYIDEKREALEKWAKYLALLCNGQRAVAKNASVGKTVNQV